MATRHLLILGAALLMCGLGVSRSGPVPKEKPGPFGETGKVREEMHKRVNGLLFTAETGSVGAELKIKWALHYTGQRQPLTILEPTLTRSTNEQTVLRIYAFGKDNKLYDVFFPSPTQLGAYLSGKDWFVTAAKGKKAKGELSVKVADIKAKFKKQYPKQFGDDPPAALAWQVEHKPRDRGEQFDFDAWTVDMYNPPVSQFTPFTLKKW